LVFLITFLSPALTHREEEDGFLQMLSALCARLSSYHEFLVDRWHRV